MTATTTVEHLNAAASLLHTLGHADPNWCGPAIRLHCLAASDHLRAAGARPERVDLDAAEATIRLAMAHLGRLPRSLFATAEVMAAAAATQLALERSQKTATDQ